MLLGLALSFPDGGLEGTDDGCKDNVGDIETVGTDEIEGGKDGANEG